MASASASLEATPVRLIYLICVYNLIGWTMVINVNICTYIKMTGEAHGCYGSSGFGCGGGAAAPAAGAAAQAPAVGGHGGVGRQEGRVGAGQVRGMCLVWCGWVFGGCIPFLPCIVYIYTYFKQRQKIK
jgi:hypothetical protein